MSWKSNLKSLSVYTYAAIFLITFLFLVFLSDDMLESFPIADFADRFLIEAAVLLPLLVLPLVLAKRFIFRMGIFILLAMVAVPLLFYWARYQDYGGFIVFYYHIPLAYFFLLIFHFTITKHQNKFEVNKNYRAATYIITILLVLFAMYVAIANVKDSGKHRGYQKVISCGNFIPYETARSYCERLTGKFWEGYYRDICFDTLRQIQSGTYKKPLYPSVEGCENL